jgi:protein gp37
MGETTGIAWTNIPGYIGGTWNPWQGCAKVSAGCTNCYMYREKARYGQDPAVVKHSAPATFNLPMKTKVPHAWFVNSWSDFFHKDADPWRAEAYDIIDNTPQHLYLILTKRIERLEEPAMKVHFPPNVWLGVTAENQEMADKRIPLLLEIPARVRFVSAEPMLSPLVFTHGNWWNGVNWVICGGESGANARPMNLEWAWLLRMACLKNCVPFFFKQIDGKLKHMEDFPEDLRVREFPNLRDITDTLQKRSG